MKTLPKKLCATFKRDSQNTSSSMMKKSFLFPVDLKMDLSSSDLRSLVVSFVHSVLLPCSKAGVSNLEHPE